MRTPPKTFPAYLALAETGEPRQRESLAVAALAECRLCPRNCGVDRARDRSAVCQVGRHARVASCFPHHGEEDCLRGSRGSGTIFFSGCGLRCCFCQNWEISREREGGIVPPERLAGMMLELQAAGCHNINWVTPSHVVPQALEALAIAAARGLRLPIIYNSGGYDSVESLRLLDGVVDIYMPDFKFWDPAVAERLAKARDWLATEISRKTYVNVMDQYHPEGAVAHAGETARFAGLRRRITAEEFHAAMQVAREAGLARFDRER